MTMPDLAWIVPAQSLVAPEIYILGVSAAAFFVGLSKAGFGGGVGVIATPLVLFLLPGPTALSLMLPLLIGCDIMTLRRFSKDWDRTVFWSLFLWIFLGLFLGLALLIMFAKLDARGDTWIRFTVGVLVTGLTTLSILAPATPQRPRKDDLRQNSVIAVIVGLGYGIATMVAHAAGVLLNLFLISRRPSPAVFVGTSTRLYLTFNLIKVPFFIAATSMADRSFLTFATFGYSLWLLPAGYLGVMLGARLNKSLPKERYLGLVNALLLITGLYMTISSGVALVSAP